MKKTIKSNMYKGMPAPEVELTEQELDEVAGADDAAITISLESLNKDLQNQHYLMMPGSTGCISNPNGPSC